MADEALRTAPGTGGISCYGMSSSQSIEATKSPWLFTEGSLVPQQSSSRRAVGDGSSRLENFWPVGR